MTNIDKRRKSIIKYIQYFTERNGYQPSYNEIGKELGVTKQRISILIKDLIDQGFIKKSPIYRGRSLVILKEQ